MPAAKKAAPRRHVKNGKAPAQIATPAAKRRATKRPTGRERVNIMVDRALLERVAAGFGTRNKSEAIHRALQEAAENDAIIAGIDAMFGAYPDLPLDDAP